MLVGNLPINQEEDEEREVEGGKKRGEQRKKKERVGRRCSLSRMKTDGQSFYMGHGREHPFVWF